MPVSIRIINKSSHPLPSYASEGSSGVDLRAFIEESMVLKQGERVAVPTGLYLEIPPGFEAQVRPRSGLAMKQGITCLNTPGTIDSDYRGEIKVLLINLSGEEQIIHNGDRIAQLVLAAVEKIHWQETRELSDTTRGEGGFGSTGKN